MSEGNEHIADAGGLTIGSPQPQQITFHVGGGEWVLRITKDGIESNPDVNVDDGAKAILEALKPYLLSLK